LTSGAAWSGSLSFPAASHNSQSYSRISHFCGIGKRYLRYISSVFADHSPAVPRFKNEIRRIIEVTLTVEPDRWNIRRDCCEVVVSVFLLTEVFATGSLVSAVCCCLLEVAMVAELRRGLAGWHPSELPRDIRVTLRNHRRFYPASRLRTAFVASSLLLGCCIAGLLVIHRITINALGIY
jgi:hypothetical protein